MKTGPQIDTYTYVIHTQHYSQQSKGGMSPSISADKKKRCYMHTLEYYSAIKMHKALIHPIKWIDLENIVTRIKPVTRGLICDSNYMKCLEKVKSYRQKVDWQLQAEKGMEFLSEMMTMFWKQTKEMVSHYCEMHKMPLNCSLLTIAAFTLYEFWNTQFQSKNNINTYPQAYHED